MAETKIKVDDKAVLKMLDRVGDKMDSLRAPFREYAQYMRVQTDNTFEALRVGGTFRGQTWRYFAPQYTRKTDGITVPVWGGVKKVRGGGLVKGRKRPSGQRIRQGDALIQDTGTLRSRAALVVRMEKYEARLGVPNVRYANDQQDMRPFLFFASNDGGVLNRTLLEYLTARQ